METETLLREMVACGLHLKASGYDLHVWPRHLITDQIRAKVKALKPALLDFCEKYEERAAIMEYGAGLPRKEAEQRAFDDLTRGQNNE